jgi:hypothetical protein
MTNKQQIWLDKECLAAIKYLEQKGLCVENINICENKYLLPLFSIWKFSLQDGSLWWVVGGDLPVDHANGNVAFCSRDAVQHFSLKWQLQAENFLKANIEDQNKLAHELNAQAKTLFQIFNDESLWITNE